MPRPIRANRERQYQLSPLARRYFLGEVSREEQRARFHSEDVEGWELFMMTWPPQAGGTEAKVWAEYGEELTEEFIERYPGYRPLCWWEYSAPEKERRRLGGIGDPVPRTSVELWNQRQDSQRLVCGIPKFWLTDGPVELWNGVSVDIRRMRKPEGMPIDFDDPPRFESQPAYLRRHGLLLEGEEERIDPAWFEPEMIMPEEGEE